MVGMEPEKVPEEYKKFVFKDPKDLAFAEKAFWYRYQYGEADDLQPVADVIQEYTHMSPMFAPLDMMSDHRVKTEETQTAFHIGVTFSKYDIERIEPVCVYHNKKVKTLCGLSGCIQTC